jgi:hypothetical protein
MVAWRVTAVLLKVKDLGLDGRWDMGARTDEVRPGIFIDFYSVPDEPLFLIA